MWGIHRMSRRPGVVQGVQRGLSVLSHSFCDEAVRAGNFGEGLGTRRPVEAEGLAVRGFSTECPMRS